MGNALLLEPIIGQVLGCVLGQDQIPGPLTFVGAAIILTGIYTVAQGTKKNTAIEEVSDNDSDSLLEDKST